MTKINTINIEDYNNFFFKEGQKAFNALVEFAESDLVKKTLEDLKKREKEKKYSISEWIAELEKEKKDLIKKINEFVSYCDINALGANEHSIEIGENIKVTAIAKAFVFQHIWVENILKYLLEPNLDNLPHSVRKAIEYFQNPKEKFPILSEGHREKIREHYKLNELYTEQPFDFDVALINYAKDKWGEYKDDESNLTYAYTIQIYQERSQWDCKVDTTLLEKNYNLILTGAPGTGKTYLARQMAKKLTNENDNNIGFVQFHPSYDYTDFVEGLRPKADNGNVVFERVDGVFKEFCKRAARAANDINNKYVFIIDEINRGEISKIFGELFFSIDPGYRGEKEDQDNTNKVIKVKTQYQNMITEDEDPFKDGFYVPENVYIIGTMNDIDRSVESMDFAFRRRFAFQEITAEESMERILYDLDDSISGIAAEKMGAINKTLNELGLNSNYHIGAAYFMKAKKYCYKYNGEIKCKWDQLWNLHLKGTLFEYFRGEPDANDKLKKLEEVYDNAGEN